jgi:hypothetical protein
MLGSHISFVQGLFNDVWSEDSLSAFLSSQGNELRNTQLLEYVCGSFLHCVFVTV